MSNHKTKTRPQNILCLGPRRTGKTSMINRMRKSSQASLSIVISPYFEDEYNTVKEFRYNNYPSGLINRLLDRQKILMSKMGSYPPRVDLIIDDLLEQTTEDMIHLLKEGTLLGISTYISITYPSDSPNGVPVLPADDSQEKLINVNDFDLVILSGPQSSNYLCYLYHKYCLNIVETFDDFCELYQNCQKGCIGMIIDMNQGNIRYEL